MIFKRAMTLEVTILTALLISACSRINPQEQAAYQNKSEMNHVRHGIVPYSEVELVKNKVALKLDPQSVQRGKVLYEQHCLSCHGVTGIGNGPIAQESGIAPANLRKTVKDVENFDFYMSVSNWKGEMPGWKNPLSKDQRNDIANYIKTFRD